MIKQVQLYDDKLDFIENKLNGPFGDYSKGSRKYINVGEPQYNFFGTPVYSPFGIAAGPLPTTRFIKSALIKGFDIVTLKSVRTDTFPLNKYPQVRPLKYTGDINPASTTPLITDTKYSQPLAVANSFGIPSVKPSEWQAEMKKSLGLPRRGQALLVAFQGTARGKGRDEFVNDHIKGVELIRDTGANVIEINLSCPNEGEAVLACFDIDITDRIVNAVRKANPDLKLIIKIAYFADKKLLKNLISRVGNKIDGISAINTIPMRVINEKGEEAFPGRPQVGVSGAPIKWAGLEMARTLNQLREELKLDYKILGVGGVMNFEDFKEYREAGADFVMSVTAAMWNPNLAAEIKKEL